MRQPPNWHCFHCGDGIFVSFLFCVASIQFNIFQLTYIASPGRSGHKFDPVWIWISKNWRRVVRMRWDGNWSCHPNLWEFFLKNDINFTASEVGLVKHGLSPVNSRLDPFTIALFIVFIVGGISLLLVRPAASGESVTVRCEKSAVSAAGNKTNFRKERKLAFERCMDESLQFISQPASSK